MKQPIVVRVYKGERLETVRQFEHSQIVIGRNSDVQLQLEDESVALLHAMIEERDGTYYLSDLGSQGGTFKNGKRVLEEQIASGEELTIGAYRIQFFIGIPKPAAPPKLAGQEPPAPPTPPPAAVSFTSLVPEPPPLVKTDLESATASPATSPATPIVPQQVAATTKPSTQARPRGRKKQTFAPVSPYRDLKEIIKPHKGSVVEVIVAWKDRILSSNHFTQKGSVYISSNEDADVIVPIISSRSKYELLRITTGVAVCLTPEMTGELVRDGESTPFSELTRQNRIRNAGTHFELELRQGEMIRVGLQGDLISIYIRFTSETPKPLMAPLLDMTSSETTGVILALAVAAILGLYMNIYTPTPLLEDEAMREEPIRKAMVKFNIPKKITEVVDKPQEKKVVEVKDMQQRTTPTPSVEKKGDPGRAGEVAPKPPSNKPKTLTSIKQGGSVKTANKEGSQMKAQKPDPTKVGLLSAFGGGGLRKQLDRASSGAGELAGMADAATGTAGFNEDRAGDDLGSKLKDTGAGGKGTSTVGIAGVGTKGRGTGGTGYGTGGIGQKGSVQINIGGQEADFAGGMDKEAIRRVIREHIREIRSCYERQLQRNQDLYGKLVLEWDIEEHGRVSRCVVKSNALGDNDVAQCIVNRLKTWKFPDPPKDQIGRVVYPFVFSSQ